MKKNEFFVCANHAKTGGYENCCPCSKSRKCSEALKENKPHRITKFMGFFWHVHHDKLVEWSGDIRERIDYIKSEKPKSEIKVRLRLMKKVKGKMSDELKEAYAKWEEADAKWEEADAKREEADAKREEAYAKWKEAYAKFLPEFEKLHKTECGCKEWNGKELVFG